jgi:hypothetical protein
LIEKEWLTSKLYGFTETIPPLSPDEGEEIGKNRQEL